MSYQYSRQNPFLRRIGDTPRNAVIYYALMHRYSEWTYEDLMSALTGLPPQVKDDIEALVGTGILRKKTPDISGSHVSYSLNPKHPEAKKLARQYFSSLQKKPSGRRR